jgi:ProP effector
MAVITLLAETWPKCFSVYQGRRLPLKLKIHLDIQAVLDGAITPAELHKALGIYCSNQVYLSHTREGAWRLDLDGNPAGVVTADEEAHARATLAGIKAKKARAAAAEAAAQPAILQPAKRLSACRSEGRRACYAHGVSNRSVPSPPAFAVVHAGQRAQRCCCLWRPKCRRERRKHAR